MFNKSQCSRVRVVRRRLISTTIWTCARWTALIHSASAISPNKWRWARALCIGAVVIAWIDTLKATNAPFIGRIRLARMRMPILRQQASIIWRLETLSRTFHYSSDLFKSTNKRREHIDKVLHKITMLSFNQCLCRRYNSVRERIPVLLLH